MISMDLVIVVALVVLQVSLQPSLAALFTVEAEHTSYSSEYGGNVVMGCRFSSKPANPQNDLKVIWHRLDGSPDQEVIRLVDNFESSASSKFKGRVKILTDELKNSWAKIQISDLRITDSGTYQCLVQTAEGTDYKTIALSVGAPYHSVSKQIERTAEGDKVVLTCQSEGYPQSPVVWQDGRLQSYSSNTTATTTPGGLIKVISQIEVSSSEKTNYTCNFTKDHSSATFHIPDDIPLHQGENDILIVVLCVGLILTAIVLGVIIYRRQKGTRTPRTHNCLAGDEESMSAAACLQKDKGNEVEEIVITEGKGCQSDSRIYSACQ
ncbi:programmed cell death 1 ligand 1-like isoform X2 [Poeciliopsis prolifica]|uniref:programmed cell death 1 ligand 1-like isoform X2 n=1 Tax=Poeciliopsis prolifica TaxID=188132 RepID=UPI0024137B05|nr:programmed cell death 1 ligand 1-like isoform X2 [Poeciliopsis prolifica]